MYTFSNDAVYIAPRRGFALRDAMERSQAHAGTYLGRALETVRQAERGGFDRVVVITDEQSHDNVGAPAGARGRAYLINVASAQHGVGYGHGWNHIDGFSEAVVEYIRAAEQHAA